MGAGGGRSWRPGWGRAPRYPDSSGSRLLPIRGPTKICAVAPGFSGGFQVEVGLQRPVRAAGGLQKWGAASAGCGGGPLGLVWGPGFGRRQEYLQTRGGGLHFGGAGSRREGGAASPSPAAEIDALGCRGPPSPTAVGPPLGGRDAGVGRAAVGFWLPCPCLVRGGSRGRGRRVLGAPQTGQPCASGACSPRTALWMRWNTPSSAGVAAPSPRLRLRGSRGTLRLRAWDGQRWASFPSRSSSGSAGKPRRSLRVLLAHCL